MQQLRNRPSLATSAMNGPGIRVLSFGHKTMMASASTDDARPRTGCTIRYARRTRPTWRESRGHRTHSEPEQVFHLARENDHGDSAREPGDDRVRNELDDPAELRGAEDDEEHAGHDVATISPSTPYFWTMPYTITTNAPVGPPI